MGWGRDGGTKGEAGEREKTYVNISRDERISKHFLISYFSIIFPARHDGKGDSSPFINKAKHGG